MSAIFRGFWLDQSQFIIQLPRHVFVFTGAWAYEISRGVLISASHNLLIRPLSLTTSSHTSNQMTVPHAPLLNMVSKASHLHCLCACLTKIKAGYTGFLLLYNCVPCYMDFNGASVGSLL